MRPHEIDKILARGELKRRIIVGGIGTGGHYYPAVVVAHALQKRSVDTVFLSRRGSMEENVALAYGLKTFTINARPFYGKSLAHKFRFIISTLFSVLRLHALTRDSVALAFGGFGAVPLLISCLINRSAYYIFEPNRVPGRATRRFASSARSVFLGLPPVHGNHKRAIVTGVPVRNEFKKAAIRRLPRKRGSALSILFYGGSQGARRLNDLALELQGSSPENWRFTIIAGTRDYERTKELKGGHTRVLSFTHTPWEQITDADIVVSRAGALAGYELLYLGKKVIFIPFPHAIDDHQYYNAEYFARVGDAICIREENISGEILAMRIKELAERKRIREAKIAKDAEDKIVDIVMGDLTDEKI